jgi:drug/metabolite transporter (DMT)-like permease
MLVLCTAFWGVSFPTTKALALVQQDALSGNPSWFIASLCVVVRFGITAMILLPFCARTLLEMTRSELEQGIGLGLFAGAGIQLQIDGMSYTSASTSAFLTQCYCLLIPIWVAWRRRRWPGARIALSCLMVIAGVAILARIDWQHLHLGRGELETLAASVVFTGQILWLERPEYARNNVNRFSLVMFVVMALTALPVAMLAAPRPGDWLRAYGSAPALGLMLILVIVCTCGGYLVMNYWQRHVSATEAGLIYCIEPVFASAFALFLPRWFSRLAGIEYDNETLTRNLLIGGGLITAANVLIQWPLPSQAGERSAHETFQPPIDSRESTVNER